MMIDPLQLAYARFLCDRDEPSLLKAIEQHGGRPPSPDVSYPSAHRICDIQLCGQPHRIARVFDAEDQSTQCFIYPIESPSYSDAGVPFSLQGNALAQWVRDEIEAPTKGPSGLE